MVGCFSIHIVFYQTDDLFLSIDDLGNIILEDILGSEWNLSMSIHTVMMSIQNLLGSPNMDSGLMSKAACIMKQDLEVFQKTAAFWTYHYAIVIKTEQMITDNAPFEGRLTAAESSNPKACTLSFIPTFSHDPPSDDSERHQLRWCTEHSLIQLLEHSRDTGC